MRFRRLFAIILLFAMFMAIFPVQVSARNIPEPDAHIFNASAICLKSLGLFRGVSETNFDLFRPATRVEALVMLIRLIGEEKNALASHYSHPFIDVPEWANDYIGFAYANGITKGVSATQFGTGSVTAAMYITYMLRILGYSDAEGDFVWNNPFDLAHQVSILDDDSDCWCDLNEFWRADMAYISESTLKAKTKNSDYRLATQLIAKGTFTSVEWSLAENEYAESAFGFFGSSDAYYDFIKNRIGKIDTLQDRSNMELSGYSEGEEPVKTLEPDKTVRTPEPETPSWTPEPEPEVIPLEPIQTVSENQINRSHSAEELLWDWYAGIPGYDENLRQIFFVNMETGKIHQQSCRYCKSSEYDWPIMVTTYPDELIDLDSFYSYCQVCCKGW